MQGNASLGLAQAMNKCAVPVRREVTGHLYDFPVDGWLYSQLRGYKPQILPPLVGRTWDGIMGPEGRVQEIGGVLVPVADHERNVFIAALASLAQQLDEWISRYGHWYSEALGMASLLCRERDSSCQVCDWSPEDNSQRRYLHGHHLVAKHKHAALALHPRNILSLCHDCHRIVSGPRRAKRLFEDNKPPEDVVKKMGEGGTRRTVGAVTLHALRQGEALPVIMDWDEYKSPVISRYQAWQQAKGY